MCGQQRLEWCLEAQQSFSRWTHSNSSISTPFKGGKDLCVILKYHQKEKKEIKGTEKEFEEI